MADRAVPAEIAQELLGLLGAGRQVEPLTARFPRFGLADAYAASAALTALREARGERPVGRKIGFTNRAVWSGHGISGPIHAPMFDTTVRQAAGEAGTFDLAGLPEPRIEPELVLHLARPPTPGMDEAALFGCVDRVAHGFEVVFSIYPGWRFGAADAAAAYGVHAGLVLGPWHEVDDDRAGWFDALSRFGVRLARHGGTEVEGHARNVLGGPLSALRFLVEEIARFPATRPIAPGEIVTTGTLTEAMPAIPGETWRSAFSGIPLEGLALTFR
ncbi:2-keto-4-pentenoate hydratase [Elioraea rosea]|uniref:2-keto-4-pentenoate hydratase n=1 Tax=Elioraea rosea TaxID=2492390 RepID=UPI001182D044|nr:hydratase [Elioraea rosea]